MTMSTFLPELSALKVGPHLKAPDFDAMPIPEAFAPVRYVADDAAIKAYCYAVDCDDRWYFSPTPELGERIAPAAMVLKELMWLYQTGYDRSRVRGFHQHESARFHAPVPCGIELILTGRNTRKYTRRGKGYFCHESEARDRNGRLYVSQTNTEIIDLDRSREPDDEVTERERGRIVPSWNEHAASAFEMGADLVPGMQLPEMKITVSRAQMMVFSGAADDFRNLHTDLAIAREMGFPDLVVQGLMNVCWLSEGLMRLDGRAWASSGLLDASFLKPMLAGQQVAIRTVVSRCEADSIEFETAFVNESGQVQAIARAGMSRSADVTRACAV